MSVYTKWEQIYPDYTSISLNSNGFIVFNNGLIIQWALNAGGKQYYEDGYPAKIPLTFPNALLHATLTTWANVPTYGIVTLNGDRNNPSTLKIMVSGSSTYYVSTIYIGW